MSLVPPIVAVLVARVIDDSTGDSRDSNDDMVTMMLGGMENCTCGAVHVSCN